jgi:hypothetical protein
MGRSTRRMIERLEPFAEPPRNASSAPLAKADGDAKDGKRKELPARPRPPAAKPRAK